MTRVLRLALCVLVAALVLSVLLHA